MLCQDTKAEDQDLTQSQQWCLDMGLETILAVWDGLYLDNEILSEADLQFYVDDMLNELEFLLVIEIISLLNSY